MSTIIEEAEFNKQLEELKKTSPRAKSILDENGNNFTNLPEFQQEMFLKYLGIKEVIWEKTP